MPYNIMSCSGWENSGFGGPCSMAWLAAVILVYVVLISRKQLGENMGVGFNLIAGFVGALVPWLLIITIFGSTKIALIAGIVGALAGGIGVGYFYDDADGGTGGW